MSDAFNRLRAYARSNNLRLHDVASSIVAGTLDIGRNDAANP